MKATSIYMSDSSDVTGIGDALAGVDLDAIGNDVSPEFTALYNNLMGLVGPQLATSYYNTGYEAYKSEDYETAISNLAKAYQYDNTNVNTLYYLGNSYYKSNDIAKAKEVYDAVITEFPNTKSAQEAQTKLAEINNSDG
jgi:TolA-binding protein